MLLSAVSVLVVAQSSSEIPEGLMNDPVFLVDHDLAMYALKENILIRFSSGKYNIKTMKLLAEVRDQQGLVT